MCCRFESGYVFLSAQDVRRLGKYLGISDQEVIRKYCRIVDIGGIRRVSLAEQENYDCVFWQNGECSVYDARPLQCRNFPFWPAHLESEEAWNEAKGSCPGIGVGPRVPRHEIEDMVARRREEPLLDADKLK
jgi:hypothetical protein